MSPEIFLEQKYADEYQHRMKSIEDNKVDSIIRMNSEK
jgi:hypothetical protein